MTKVGTKKVTKIYVGTTPVKKVYLGSRLVWDNGAPTSARLTDTRQEVEK